MHLSGFSPLKKNHALINVPFYRYKDGTNLLLSFFSETLGSMIFPFVSLAFSISNDARMCANVTSRCEFARCIPRQRLSWNDVNQAIK
jgi:hypothetical protein